MTDNLNNVFEAQLNAFNAEEQPSYNQRITNLKKLMVTIESWEERIVSAISKDFSINASGGRAGIETIIAETLLAKTEIKYTIKHLKKWMRTKRVSTAIHFKPSRSEIRIQPIGVIGILSPWNYPFQLVINPLIPALAAGNRIMIKPSEHTPNTSSLIKEMLHSIFDSKTVFVATGGVDVASSFSELPFHHIFFTGSTTVGKIVAQAAAKNLTPVTLELGGKSPVVIDESADLTLATQRLVYGKLVNSGQTCTAPDYILMPKKSIPDFANKMILAAEALYPTWADNTDYTSIINDDQYQRQIELIKDAKAKGATIRQAGQDSDNALTAARKIPLTLILNPTLDMRIMQEEIFGPLLPVFSCETPDEATVYINNGERPLALYWFGKHERNMEKVLKGTLSGGVTINDTLLHVVQENMPFGGIGASGMGAYHGDYGFKSFSHERAVFLQSRYAGSSMLYPPYTKKTKKILALMKKFA